jgi:hypothetical protein
MAKFIRVLRRRASESRWSSVSRGKRSWKSLSKYLMSNTDVMDVKVSLNETTVELFCSEVKCCTIWDQWS